MGFTKLPTLDELLWLFEVEPERLDPEVALPYNTLIYRTARGGEDVTISISPSSRDLEFLWERDGRQLIHLTLTAVEELRAVKEGERESLRVRFDAPRLLPLSIQLKPSVSVHWGMDQTIES